MESCPQGIFLNTRKQENRVFSDSEIEKYVSATHWCNHPEAKGLLRVDPKYYKTHKDKDYIVFGLMTLGGDLIKKNEIEEAAVAYFKAFKIDAENATVKKFLRWCGEPNSVEDVERAIRARKEIRARKIGQE